MLFCAEGFDQKNKPDQLVFDAESTDNYYSVLIEQLD
jgi:hypothetical protein